MFLSVYSAAMESYRYRVSFPAGFRALAERLLARDFGGADRVREGDESSVVLSAEGPFKDPGYLQGASLVIDSIPAPSLERAYRTFAERLASAEPRRAVERAARDRAFMRSGRAERFALRGFVGAEPTFPGEAARAALEAAVSRATGLRPDSERPDVDLSVSLRSDGMAYFSAALRLGRGAPENAAGALPRCTARLLCELSYPEATDTFLDPFMGSGAIPLERALMGPYNMIFAGDREEALVAAFKERLKDGRFERKKRTIFPKILDARDLSRFEDGLFSAIVTDPPWGDWERLGEAEVAALYAAFLSEAARVSRPDGRLVLLVGRSDALERALDAAGRPWRIVEGYEVLVSGKKARAILLRKK